MEELTIIGITISNWVMVGAVLAGPVLAIQVQKFIESSKEAKERRVRVFKDLMTTRASTLAYQHVVAINMVGLEFQGKKYKKVVSAWVVYLDHLSSFPTENESMTVFWAEKTNDLLSDLIYEMGLSLGFSFDKVHIKKAGYIPKAYADQESEQIFIRKSLVEILSGNKAIPFDLKSVPVNEEVAGKQQQLQEAMLNHYNNDNVVKVKLINDE